MLAGHSFDMTRKFIEKYGDTVFLMSGNEAPFPGCNRALGFDKFYDSLINDPGLLHAIMERHTESIIQHAKALAQLGVHGMRINEYWCSAELISEEHYLKYAFPYEQRVPPHGQLLHPGCVIMLNSHAKCSRRLCRRWDSSKMLKPTVVTVNLPAEAM